MKKISYLIVLALVLGLIFAGCGDIANITTPSDVDSSLEKNSLPITWTGQGSNAQNCELIGTSAERTEAGWIHWILSGAKGVTGAELVLGGSGSGTYSSTKSKSVVEFFTPYFDLDTLTAVVNYSGSLKKNSQFVISDYCPGESGPTTYTVTFDSNGGSAVDPVTDIAYNATITLPADPTKAGNIFAGWFSDDTTFLVPFTASTPVTASITVYAKWTDETYTVTFDSNGGSAVTPVTGIAYNATVTLPTDPTLAGNTFAEWFTDDGTFTNPFTAATPVTASITVYAQWTADTYTVTFDSNGGSAVDPVTGIAYNATVTLPAAPTKALNTFAEWFTDDGTFTNPFTAATPVTASITVYAQWTADTYTVTMAVSPGGSGTATDATATGPYEASASVNITAVANEGYQFVNWTAPAGAFIEATSSSTFFTMPAQDVTVTANFEEFTPPTYTSESCFVDIFDPSTGTIVDRWSEYAYNSSTCGTDVIIPPTIGGDPVLHIGQMAFWDRNGTISLTSVIIPYGVTSIGSTAFYGNELTSVTIPDSMTTIADSAFQDNLLSSVDIPDQLTTIAEGAFSDNQLTSVDIPYGVTSIGSWAFGINNLTSVTIPNSVTNIGRSAFNTNQLTSVTIPNSVAIIGEAAFGQNNLTSVTIGAGVAIDPYYNTMGQNTGFKSVYDGGGQLAGTYHYTGVWPYWEKE